MERYGFLRKSREGDDLIAVHECLFPDIRSCVHAGVCQEQYLDNPIHYFKILNNKEIIENMHTTSENNASVFSYFHLHRMTPTRSYAMCSVGEKLYSSLLKCVLSTKCKPTADMSHASEYKLKVAYYKLMSDDELLKELHHR